MTDFEERVSNLERRANEGEMPSADFASRLESALAVHKIGRAVRQGELSPVVLVRLQLITNRVVVASIDAGMRRVHATVAMIGKAVTHARLTQDQRAQALCLLHRATTHVDSALTELREAMNRVGAVRRLQLDGEVFVVAGNLLQDVVAIPLVGAAYRQLLGDDTPLAVSVH